MPTGSIASKWKDNLVLRSAYVNDENDSYWFSAAWLIAAFSYWRSRGNVSSQGCFRNPELDEQFNDT